MNVSEMKDQMNGVLIKMSQEWQNRMSFELEFCSKANFGSTGADEDDSINNTNTGV